MALSCCFFRSQVSVTLEIDHRPRSHSSNSRNSQRCAFSLQSMSTQLFGLPMIQKEVNQCSSWNFLGGSTTIRRRRPNRGRNTICRKKSVVYASWMATSQIASSAFTLGTAAVLPFYTFMVVAPQAEFTKKLAASSIPYIVLGVLYAYLLYLSWTPETIRLMFASKYWLPELPGIAKMFSSEMTLASAWIHLLAVDLFAARQVYFDGLRDKIETRHSVSLCLLFCPIGILAHFITRALNTNS